MAPEWWGWPQSGRPPPLPNEAEGESAGKGEKGVGVQTPLGCRKEGDSAASKGEQGVACVQGTHVLLLTTFQSGIIAIVEELRKFCIEEGEGGRWTRSHKLALRAAQMAEKYAVRTSSAA